MPPEPEQPWDDVSIDYGFVAVAPKINARKEEERERRHGSRGDGNNLRDEHQKSLSGQSYKKKEWRVENGHAAGIVTPQAKPHRSQKSTHSCPQKHTPIHPTKEVCNRVQAQACFPINSASLNQTRGATNQEEGGEFLGLLPNKTPQIDLFHIPLNLRTNKRGGLGEEMLMADGKIDEGVEEGGARESVPLLSAYASQNIKDMSTSHTDQSDYLPDECGVLRQATVDQIGKDEDEVEEEQEEGTIFIDWDPKARKLVFPEMAFTGEGGLDWSLQTEKGRDNRVEGGEEEVNAMRGKLLLENVFVRQASEEEAEAQREMEVDGERRWEASDILARWNLVISMDE